MNEKYEARGTAREKVVDWTVKEEDLIDSTANQAGAADPEERKG